MPFVTGKYGNEFCESEITFCMVFHFREKFKYMEPVMGYNMVSGKSIPDIEDRRRLLHIVKDNDMVDVISVTKSISSIIQSKCFSVIAFMMYSVLKSMNISIVYYRKRCPIGH